MRIFGSRFSSTYNENEEKYEQIVELNKSKNNRNQWNIQRLHTVHWYGLWSQLVFENYHWYINLNEIQNSELGIIILLLVCVSVHVPVGERTV